MSTVSMLRKARDVIEKEGWAQGHYYNREGGGFCASGALFAAAYGVEYVKGANYDLTLSPALLRDSIAARAVLHSALPKGYLSMIDYNDSIGRTMAEILALLDKAIALAEAA